MSVYFYAYKPTGEIVMAGNCPDEFLGLQSHPGCTIAEGQADPFTQYRTSEGLVANRPNFEEVITGTTISNLPNPTTVTAEGVDYVITDGSAELTFNLPGTYDIILKSFPYLSKTVQVTQL